jgi:hypothetical protein
MMRTAVPNRGSTSKTSTPNPPKFNQSASYSPHRDGGKPDHVTLYQSRNEDSVDHVLHIPVRMVRTMKVLMELEIKT